MPDFPRPDLWLSFRRTQSFMALSFAVGKRWWCSSIFPLCKPAHLFSAASPHLLRHLAPPIPVHFQKLAKQPAKLPCCLLLPACYYFKAVPSQLPFICLFAFLLSLQNIIDISLPMSSPFSFFPFEVKVFFMILLSFWKV